MLKSEYNRMNENINPDERLKESVMQNVTPRRFRRLRPVVAIAAVLMVVLMAVPAMAAYVPAINELMFQVSPEMAARFTPIQESCTKNGIRMEVVSASIHGATAEICISFEDVKGNQIDGRLRVGDYQLLGSLLDTNPFLTGSWGGGIGNFSYDPETGKAIMVIEENHSVYSEWRGRYLTADELFSGKITVQVDYLYRLAETDDGDYREDIIAEGPWRVTFEITESDYVGEHDDGVPQTEEVLEY